MIRSYHHTSRPPTSPRSYHGRIPRPSTPRNTKSANVRYRSENVVDPSKITALAADVARGAPRLVPRTVATRREQAHEDGYLAPFIACQRCPGHARLGNVPARGRRLFEFFAALPSPLHTGRHGSISGQLASRPSQPHCIDRYGSAPLAATNVGGAGRRLPSQSRYDAENDNTPQLKRATSQTYHADRLSRRPPTRYPTPRARRLGGTRIVDRRAESFIQPSGQPLCTKVRGQIDHIAALPNNRHCLITGSAAVDRQQFRAHPGIEKPSIRRADEPPGSCAHIGQHRSLRCVTRE